MADLKAAREVTGVAAAVEVVVEAVVVLVAVSKEEGCRGRAMMGEDLEGVRSAGRASMDQVA